MPGMVATSESSRHDVHHHHFPPHDGFAMFDSKSSDWNIVHRTPYEKGPAECLRRITPGKSNSSFINYSQLIVTTRTTIREAATSWNTDVQTAGIGTLSMTTTGWSVAQLLTNYGPAGASVRWDVGLAMPIGTYPNVCRDSSVVATGGAHHSEPSSDAETRRGCSQTSTRSFPAKAPDSTQTTISTQLPLEASTR